MKEEYPFGITPDMLAEFDRKQEADFVYSPPIRDIEKEDFWDFMNRPAERRILTPHVLQIIREAAS